MNCYDDVKVQELGIGFTNICARTTKGSEELKRSFIFLFFRHSEIYRILHHIILDHLQDTQFISMFYEVTY